MVSPENHIPHAFNNEKMHALYPLMENILQKMKEDQRTSYDLVIGDDFSGRIPAYIMINTLRLLRQGNISGFLFKPHRYSEVRTTAVMEEELRKRKSEASRALFVTEEIHSGISVNVLGKSLRHLGISFDVAAVSAPRDKVRNSSELLGSPEARIYVGHEGIIPPVYLHGDYKMVGLPLHPEIARRTQAAPDYLKSALNQAKATKEDIRAMSRDLATKVFESR